MRISEYKDGSSQRMQLASSSRRTWRMSKRLTATEASTLRNWFDAHQADAFYFYDLRETLPPNTWDATGTATAGRYVVRLNSDWRESIGMPRTDLDIELIELQGPSESITSGDISGGGTVDGGISHGYSSGTGARLYILTSHIPGTPIGADAMCSIDGLGLFSRGWMNDYSAWTLRTDHIDLSFSNTVDMEALNVLFADGTNSPTTLTIPEEFRIYDAWIVVSVGSGITQTRRAASATINTSVWNQGSIANPGSASDADPTTYALISQNSVNTLNFSKVLVLTDWSIIS